MKLIDADRIVYSWIIDADGEEHDGVTLQSIIHKMPTIDAVEVVRCKDCKWSDWYTTADGHMYCYCMETGNGGRTENDYCSYGETESEVIWNEYNT